MKALVGTCNQEKALVGAFSVIVKLRTSRRFVAVLWQRPHWSRSGAAVSGPLVTAPPRTHIQFGSGDNFLPTSDCVCEYDTPSLDSLKYSFRAKINFRFQLGTAHDGPKLGWI